VETSNPLTLRSNNKGAEIGLRSAGLCNLTEVIIRPEDTFKTLKDKVEVATIIGTYQSMLTEFRYVRKVWQHNAEEERLLGVSMTGIMDHDIMGETEDVTGQILRDLRDLAIHTNKVWAEKLGISQSVAITTVK
jgi:ribonucleoside-diphosphate reductase alpha chain